MSHPSLPQSIVSESLISEQPDYETWTREDLIARLKELTTGPSIAQSCSITTTSSTPAQPSPPPKQQKSLKKSPKKQSQREFNFSAYPTRKIALKFSYAGTGYGGLAWQPGPTPLPTVEGVLFAALAKARLVDPDGGLEGCGWERCGRTDRGVSAAGQVVSLYVRSSNRPRPSTAALAETSRDGGGDGGGHTTTTDPRAPGSDGPSTTLDLGASAPPRTEEEEAEETTAKNLRYLHTLNGILPLSIRVYAWAPVAPAFSARFSCRARHYKYFFSGRNVDVDAMRAGAARLVGEHDFRNLCKLDPAKQLTSFRRRILRADISPVVVDHHNGHGSNNIMHVLDLVGTAFLYNQVRHIMAVLLLIGARLESPSVISALLNADPGSDESGGTATVPTVPEGEESPPRVTSKPEYQMADALPLVLWDCVYAAEDAPWRTDDAGSEGGSVGLHAQMTGLAERAQVEATLAEHFLAAASEFHAPAPGLLLRPPERGERGPWDIPLGGGMVRREGTYVRLLKRKRLARVEEVNAGWLRRKGM